MDFTLNILSRIAKAENFLFCLKYINFFSFAFDFHCYVIQYLLFVHVSSSCQTLLLLLNDLLNFIILLLHQAQTFIFNCVTQVLYILGCCIPFRTCFFLPQSIDNSLKFIDFSNCTNSIFCLVVSANCKYQQHLALTVETYTLFKPSLELTELPQCLTST